MSIRLKVVTIGVATIAMQYAGVASAQEVVPAPEPDEQAVQKDGEGGNDIVVTGSRILRRDFVTPSPISTVTSEDILSTGELTLEKSLMQLPQFGLGDNANSTGFNTTGQATLNLRGLGSFRNLVLLDGKRMQPSNVLQAVDVTTIPTALIESVEVITGGASSTYGSDAVAGVVNFRTKKNFSGLTLDSQYNITQRGDGAAADITATAGGNFAEGRGNAVLAVSYSHRDVIRFNSGRRFFEQYQGQSDLRIATGAYTPGANRPSQRAVDAIFSQYGIAPGTVSRASALGFNGDGTLFSASNGVHNLRDTYGSLLIDVGSQVNSGNVFSIQQAPLERVTVFGRATYDLTPNVEAFAQVHYADYSTQVVVEPGNTQLVMPVSNPFIPAPLRTLLATRADPNAPVTLQKRFYEAGPRLTNRDFEVVQVQAGFLGKLAAIDGTWELFGSHGKTTINENQPGSVLLPALNALINAPDGGASLCEGGYNPFGVVPLSKSCANYLVAAPYRNTRLDQTVVEFNMQGGLLTLPGGQLRFAAGASYRENGYKTEIDPILQRAEVVGVLFTSNSSGKINAKEGYFELSAPLLRDVPFANRLELDAGYRYSQYNLSGGAHTYKANVLWSPVEMLMFRGGYARAIRAPSVGELFVPNNGALPNIGSPTQGLGDPCSVNNTIRNAANTAGIRSLCLAQGVPAGVVDTFVNLQLDTSATNSGNRNLRPETADTFTFGAVLSPHFATPWLSRFNLSVDYYNLKLKDAIGVIGTRQTLNSCFNIDGSNPTYSNDTFSCNLINRDAGGSLVNVTQPTTNLGGYNTSGIDFQLDWTIDLDAVGLSGQFLDLNSSVSWLDKFLVQNLPNGPYADFGNTVSGFNTAGQLGTLPEWKATTSLTYRRSGGSVGLRWRYLGAMDNAARATNPATTIPGQSAYHLFDLFGTLSLNKGFSLRMGVNNLLDTPPQALFGRAGTTEPSTYDIMGRRFYLGVSTRF